MTPHLYENSPSSPKAKRVQNRVALNTLGGFAVVVAVMAVVSLTLHPVDETHGVRGHRPPGLMVVGEEALGGEGRPYAVAAERTTRVVQVSAMPEVVVRDAPVVIPSVAPRNAEVSQPMFDGRPIRPVRNMNMVVTAYSPDARSCGKWADGKTASGYSVWTNGMKLVAADTRMLPFGTLISIPGYNGGRPVPVLDRGGKIKGRRLDVLYPTHEIAREWGRQSLQTTVWEYAD